MCTIKSSCNLFFWKLSLSLSLSPMNWSSSPSSNVWLLGTTNKKIPNFPCFLLKIQSLGKQSSLWRKKIFFDSQSFLWKLQWNTFSSLIVQSLLVLGPPQELIFIFNISFYYFLFPSKLVVLNSHPINYPFIVFWWILFYQKSFYFEDI